MQVLKHMACVGKDKNPGSGLDSVHQKSRGRLWDGTGRMSPDNEEFTVEAKVLLNGCARICSFLLFLFFFFYCQLIRSSLVHRACTVGVCDPFRSSAGVQDEVVPEMKHFCRR